MFSRGVQCSSRPTPTGECKNARGTKAFRRWKGVSVAVHAHPLLSRSSSRTRTPHTTVVKSTTETLAIISHASRNWKHCREAVSIKGFSDWQAITPNAHYDWVGQRNAVMPFLSSTHSAQKKQRQEEQTMRYLNYILNGYNK